MIIVAKYIIGQHVFRPTWGEKTVTGDCPDCLGTRKMRLITPAGSDIEIGCVRCGMPYYKHALPSRREFVPAVTPLTIGSIRTNTAPHTNSDFVEYMCCETGIGSGDIYNESDLFSSHEEALNAATIKVCTMQTDWDSKPEVKKLAEERLHSITDISNHKLQLSEFETRQATLDLLDAMFAWVEGNSKEHELYKMFDAVFEQHQRYDARWQEYRREWNIAS